MATTHINGVELYHEVHGDGPPLLLVAGLASDANSWDSVAGRLGERYRVIVLDNRGTARTKPLETEITIARMADDCVALIRHLGLPSVNLLGHSMGGSIAMDIALRYPEVVDKLVLVGTAASGSKRNISLLLDWAAWLESGMDPEMWFRNIFYWVFSSRFFEDEKTVRDFIDFEIAYPYPIDKTAFRRQVEALAAFDCSRELSGIKAETLVVAARDDLLFPPDECAVLARAIPGASFEVVDNAGHSTHVENPQGFIDCIVEFIPGR